MFREGKRQAGLPAFNYCRHVRIVLCRGLDISIANSLQLCRATLAVMAQSDEEDDYMKMTFDDAPKEPQYETSLQRAARKRKEVWLPLILFLYEPKVDVHL
jgi:hypothetical protein